MSEDTVLALVSGEFEEARACVLLAEAERCGDCSLLLHEAGRAIAEDGTDCSDTLPWLHDAGVLRVGSIIAARFRVLRLLGRGGMGEVYEAFDSELDELVALKTIRTAHATLPSSIERFRQEVRLARRVVHPNVCRVLEFGRHQTEGGAPVYFLTMELLRGELLSRYLRREGRLSAEESVDIARQISAGLGAIHAQGVLHRDIKPSNVMLCFDQAQLNPQGRRTQRVVLLDFGIARSLALGPTTRSNNALLGTPDYMAPEQLQAQPLTPVTDIYALGMVLFELLSGELPFANDPTLTRALKRLQGAAAVATTGAGELPPKLERLIARCLAVAPSERPQSTGALLRELTVIEQELSGPSVPNSSRSAAGSTRMPASARARLLLASAVVAAIGVVVALSGQTLRPSSGVIAAFSSHQPAPPAVLPASARANSALPRTAEPALPDGVAQPNPQQGRLASKRRSPEPSPAASTPARHASTADSARAPAPVERSCSPPYHFDRDGFRVYRKECL